MYIKDISKVELNKLDKFLLYDMEERLNFCNENIKKFKRFYTWRYFS